MSLKKQKRANPISVIQKHDATILHYDFCLEIDGVLKPGLVPKGLINNPRVKRMASSV